MCVCGGGAILGIQYMGGGGGLAIQGCLVFNLYLNITVSITKLHLQDTSSIVLVLLIYSP